MLGQRHRRGHRSITPPRKTILSEVLGEFLDPIDALFTIFYSILFALLFTLAYDILIYRGVRDPDPSGTFGQEYFFAILGAVAAWGIIDGVMHVLGEFLARSERYRLLQSVQTSRSEEEAVSAIAYELDFILEPVSGDEQRHALYRDVAAHLMDAEPQAARLRREDVIGGVATALLAIAAVLPSLLPLLLLPGNIALAVRFSSVVSLLAVFATGYSWGVHASISPWKTGLLLASACLVAFLVALLLEGY
jgi:VIT1/CCC1 family predicted Fe2+/Mn2+ transporter